MKKIPVENRDDIYRDSNSGAVLSKNLSGYEIRKRMIEQKKKETIEINTLKDEVKELRNIVNKLIDKDSIQ